MFKLIPETHIDFMGKRRIFYIISCTATLIGLVAYVLHGGFKYGIDFEGGRLIEIRTSQPLAVDHVRAATADIGFAAAEIQRSAQGNDFLIRIPGATDQKGGAESPSSLIRRELTARNPGLTTELLREENIGAKVGKEIRNQAFLAILISWGLLLIYVAFRFEFWFGVGAVVATVHDILLTLTLLLLLGREISMPVIAALLTLAGYSINDTIIVFDRIREELVKLRREPLESVINISVNRTLSRTMITVLTVLFTSSMLLVFGGPVIRDFAIAMTFGMAVGTYSSVFVASSLALDIRRGREMKTAA
jgi:preprotein translocase SecF subunit